jgi:hypothetical protein
MLKNITTQPVDSIGRVNNATPVNIQRLFLFAAVADFQGEYAVT